MKRIVTGVLWVSLLACGAAPLLACGDEFGDCRESSGQAAFTAQTAKQGTVAGLTTAFNVADGGEGGPDNGKFNGIDQTIDRIKTFEENCAQTADQVDDNREPDRGATQGQVTDMKAQFQGAIDYINERLPYLRGKKDELAAIPLEPMAPEYRDTVSAMKDKLDNFINKFEAGKNRLASARNAIAVGTKEDDCKRQADEIKKLREDDLEPARDQLNDTIGPVKDKREDAISDLQEFTCRCSTAVSTFQFEQQQAQIAQLQEDNRRLQEALAAQGIQVDPQAVQGSIDETDTGAPGSPRVPTDAQPASGQPAGGQPPAGPDAPRGRALTQEEAQGGLGAIAFANCAQMGYECSAAAIYGPGGMVEVLARNITNRDVTNPNLINAGDMIDFEAVDAANN